MAEITDGAQRFQVALLLDFENLILAFKQRRGADPDAVRVEPVVEFLEENFGDVIFRRAYADWSSPAFNAHQEELQNLGVEMVHVRRRSPRSMKNGADILLTADAVECLLLRPFVEVFAIVSGDSDIGPLVTKLKSHGKIVVVVGPDQRSTARHVIELADRFKFYDDIAAPEEPPTPAKRRRNRGRRASPQRAVIELLAEAGDPVESATLKRRLLELPGHRDFQEKALGFKTWTSFLHSIDEVRVDRREDLGIQVGLREET